MYHCRVILNGPPAATAAVAAEIGQPPGERCFVVARDIGFWEPFSSRHRDVAFSIECFEDLGHELLHLVVRDGELTEMFRESLRPRYLVSLDGEEGDPWEQRSAEEAELVEWLADDDEGEPMDEGRVRMAAGRIAEARMRLAPTACDHGLAVALTIGSVLGSLCRQAERTALGEPTAEALDAVASVAAHALAARGASDRHPAGREFQLALTLARSAAHAASDRYHHETWSDWLRLVIGSVGTVLDAATSPIVDGAGLEVHSVAAEHHCTASEMLDLEVHGLLTTCIQALALFGEADRSRT